MDNTSTAPHSIKTSPAGSDYDNKRDVYYRNARPEMLKFIPENATSILEIGCGGGDFAALVKQQRQVRYTAIEPYPEAASRARDRVDQLIEESVESALAMLAGQSFDCIVLNDVLEHMVDPWAVVASLNGKLNPQGVVIASIPNVRYFPVLKALALGGEWEYKEHGVLDRTHLRFFTKSAIHDMFTSNNYKVLRLEGINSIRLPWKFNLLNRFLGQRFEDTRHLQYACVAKAKISAP